MICDSHSCVRLKYRTCSSPGYDGPPRYVVQANGSGTGSLFSCQINCPVLKCHHASESPVSVENQPSSRTAASARITDFCHAGVGDTGCTCSGAGLIF